MKQIRVLVSISMLILLAASPASSQTVWTKYSGNPVMDVGPTGAWDDLYVIVNCVIRVQDTLKMWYSGARNLSSGSIGYAISTDGGITWGKHPSNPVLTATQSWEVDRVLWPYVLSTDSQYKMWYSGAQSGQIGYATSPDGIVWTKYAGNPVITREPSQWDSGGVGWSSVLDTTGGFKMWFEGANAGYATVQIGYATAKDETTWTTNTGNPVLATASGSWDSPLIRSPRVLFDGKKYSMWYTGGSSVLAMSGIGYAVSPDGTTWTKDGTNPVLRPTPSSWDAQGLYLGDVLFDGISYHMWYSGSDGSHFRVGYATAQVTAVREVPSNFPTAFVLQQNFPNPFNPSTKIQFTVVSRQFTALKIFDMLGREAATLVNEMLNPGSYEVTWDASGFPSGTYFYTLTVGEFTETKKLLLLR